MNHPVDCTQSSEPCLFYACSILLHSFISFSPPTTNERTLIEWKRLADTFRPHRRLLEILGSTIRHPHKIGCKNLMEVITLLYVYRFPFRMILVTFPSPSSEIMESETSHP
uniref:NR LBD domain-containing protein n=1 Tax=Caenorhabditis tropicalis TaxID=1561998 RepID=A0A1I7SYM2_9PELO